MTERFEIGGQAVCVNDRGWIDDDGKADGPTRGQVLTIQDMAIHPRTHDLHLFFCGWPEALVAFVSWAFRPCKKTDISQFEELLKPIKKEKRKRLPVVG